MLSDIVFNFPVPVEVYEVNKLSLEIETTVVGRPDYNKYNVT